MISWLAGRGLSASNSWCVGSSFNHRTAPTERHDHGYERQVVVARVAHDYPNAIDETDDTILAAVFMNPKTAPAWPPGIEAHGTQVRLLQQDARVGQRQEGEGPGVARGHDRRDHEEPRRSRAPAHPRPVGRPSSPSVERAHRSESAAPLATAPTTYGSDESTSAASV